MTRGKVVLVPFPFDDFSGTKVRPAVCLTEPIGTHRHVILAFITEGKKSGNGNGGQHSQHEEEDQPFFKDNIFTFSRVS